MCYFVIAVKRGKKRDRAGVEQRPPPPPLFPIHATFSKFSQFEWCKINLFLQYSEEVHGLHCLSWKLFLQLGYCNIFFLFDQWAYYYYKNCGLSISWVIAFCTRLSPQKWPISLFLNGVDIFTFKPFNTKILDFKTNHVFNARRDINIWHAKFTKKG